MKSVADTSQPHKCEGDDSDGFQEAEADDGEGERQHG